MTNLKSFDEMLGDMVQTAHESGELRHLYGKPLDFSDDPDWLVNNVLKNAGVTHPTLEARREIETLRAQAEELVSDLERRRECLQNRAEPLSAREIQTFNHVRRDVLHEFERRLNEYNSRSETFNMTNLEALRLPWAGVEPAVSAAGQRIPELAWAAPPDRLPNKTSRRPRFLARWI